MKPEELRVLDGEELVDRLKSSRRELYELRFKLAVGQLDDHRQIRKVRQDIARILTFKRQRELGLIQDEQAEPAGVAAPAATQPAEAKDAEPSASRGVVPPEMEQEEEEG